MGANVDAQTGFALARKENRLEKKLMESDCLLGVFDRQRMGAIVLGQMRMALFLTINRSKIPNTFNGCNCSSHQDLPWAVLVRKQELLILQENFG